MNFYKSGTGREVVVLSHALALDHGMWDEVASSLARRYTVVRYDHRGHGSNAASSRPQTIEDLADDAAAAIRQASSSPVVFAGLSLGGMVGLALAARHPELLRGLAVLNSTAHYADRGTWNTRIQAVREGGMQAIVDGSIERWLTPAFRQTPQGQAAADRLRSTSLRMDPQAYVYASEAIANMDLRPAARRIEVPTLIVAGTQDMATTPAMSDALAKEIPHAQRADVDAAHISAVEAPEKVSALLERWMQTLEAGAPR